MLSQLLYRLQVYLAALEIMLMKSEWLRQERVEWLRWNMRRQERNEVDLEGGRVEKHRQQIQCFIIYMIVGEQKTLLKDKKFLGLLVFGIVTSLIGLIVRAIYNENIDSCIDSSICGFQTICFQGGLVYCCGGGYLFCGGYNNCSIYSYDNNYENCDGLIVAQWVMFGISVAVLLGLIFMAKKHQQAKMRSFALENIQRQNIIYSDAPHHQNLGQNRNNANLGNLNQSIESEYQRI